VKKYRRIEVNAYRRCVTVVSGGWRPDETSVLLSDTSSLVRAGVDSNNSSARAGVDSNNSSVRAGVDSNNT
jgi:hypothetical protein